MSESRQGRLFSKSPPFEVPIPLLLPKVFGEKNWQSCVHSSGWSPSVTVPGRPSVWLWAASPRGGQDQGPGCTAFGGANDWDIADGSLRHLETKLDCLKTKRRDTKSSQLVGCALVTQKVRGLAVTFHDWVTSAEVGRMPLLEQEALFIQRGRTAL